jgi:very-short-patch-repair endonuclease
MVEVLSREQLLLRLGSRWAADRAVEAGDWQRVLRGAYAPGDATVDLTLRSQAAQLLLPPEARVADRCLLWVLGVDVLPPGPPVLEVVVPRDVTPPRRRDLRARSTLIPAGDCCLLQPLGLRCLRPVRAVADLLRRLPLAEAVVVCDAVQRAALATEQSLSEELDRHAGLRGIVQARRVLTLADARAESPPESRLRLALVLDGLRPVPQYEIRVDGRLVARVDLALPELRIAIEYDGREVHEREDVFVRDRQRQNELVRAGWVVLRFTAADLRGHGRAALAQVQAAIAARAAA